MLAAIASAALIVGGSLAIGQALLTLCGRRDWTWLAGPVGLAALLSAAAIVAGLGGEGLEIAIALGVLIAAGAVACAVAQGGPGGLRRRLRSTDARTPADMDVKPPPSGTHRLAPPAAAVALATIAAAIPFIASWDVGILGVGLVNDDMASHLLLADWIDERFRPEPVLIDQGYPLGPHALVAGLAALLAASSIDVFAGLTLAIPALTALVAFSALDGLASRTRVAASALVALPYLAAAYLAQEAFKEPIMALFVLTFALLLARARDWRDAIPLGVLGAGVVYVYSFPGLAWLGGVLGIWTLIALIGRRRADDGPRGLRSMDARTVRSTDAKRPRGAVIRMAALATAVGIAALALLVAPELDRVIDFADFRALHPDRANEGGLGNLPGQLDPLEALGIWPTSEFRLSAAASSLPAAIFYVGGGFALIALALALPWWVRAHGAAVPAALAAAAVLYLLALALGTVYTSAKALAIAAPLVALITLGGLLASVRRPLRIVGAAFGLLAAFCSFLILRQAPVAPTAHADELARIRPLVEGERLLFLGRDNFILYELRGSKPYTHVRNFYDPYFVEPNFELAQVGSKFDFDSVTAATLARFPYVLATRARYASGPPPGYRVVERTDSYELWEKRRSPLGRRPAETGPEPGRVDGCPRKRPRKVAAFAAKPVVAEASQWSRTTIESGESASVELDLPGGIWDLSLQYDATRPLTIADTADRLDFTLPGNLDYRGTAPFWPAGRIVVAGPAPVEITAEVEPPPLPGRVLGADSVAHLGALAATRAEPERSGCKGYVDWTAR